MIETTLLAMVMGTNGVAAGADVGFVDVTDAVGLGPDIVPETVARVVLADINGDGWPDAVIDRHRVFLNVADDASPIGRRFEEVPADQTGLREPQSNTATIFVDVTGDGVLDAVVGEYIDRNNPDWDDHGRRTGWHHGRGDGTFGPRQHLPLPPKTTIAIAAGDVTGNGRVDLYFGNTYAQPGSYEGYTNDLLLNVGEDESGDVQWWRAILPEDAHEFDREHDRAGRPTFGAMIVRNPVGDGPMLLELSYGRRWNRAWVRDDVSDAWRDVAPTLGLDGDDVRDGEYPEWLKQRWEERFGERREDEDRFRANGNTFDAAVGDVNNNGRFDLFISEITHGWAGDSSDRSRFLFNVPDDDAAGETNVPFVEREAFNVDRIPPEPDDPDAPHDWNHGDLFCELADFDHDGRLDLLLSSGDYPDNQRLRIFRQRSDGAGIEDVTAAWNIDHDGSQQISLGDVDGDGALDVLVGQTFNRFTAEQREGRSPRLRVLVNRAAQARRSVMLRLRGDGSQVNTRGIGAVVRAEVIDDGGDRVTMQRQLVGPGGHAGKQHDFVVHFGMGLVDRIERLVIEWPDRASTTAEFTDLSPGRYDVAFPDALEFHPHPADDPTATD